jgi:AbrB family looped-hinge helix DNA binding protein
MATMTSKGQVTIPKQVREQLHLKPHDKLLFMTEADRAILRPIQEDVRGLKGFFRDTVKGPPDFKALRKEFEKARGERQRRILERSRSQ